MNRLLRTFLLLPALILMLVMIPTMVISGGLSWTAYAAAASQNAFLSPLPPGSTVPSPTPRPPHHHPHPYPTATPYYVPPTATLAPTPTATATPATDAVSASGHRLKKVIGDRLSNVIYGYTTDGWLYRSPDDGASWNLVISSPQVDNFIMSAANPNVLYSGKGAACDPKNKSAEPMYKSVNGGLTWVALPDSNNKRPLLANQGNADSLFAADCKTPYLSTDGGQTWTARPDTSSAALWDSYRVVGMTAAALLGDPRPAKANWDQIFAGGISADGSGVVAFTNDQGKTWVRLTPNVNPASWGMTALAADPFIEGLIGFAEPKGVWTTENYGVDWKFSKTGLQDALSGDGAHLNDLVHHASGEFYLATAHGLYAKALASTSWDKITGTAYENTEVTKLLFTESNPDTLWLNTADGVYTYQAK